tara:strand:- start:226 stop:492 length:267 start_codon:yes stop_codon:yes gene_type:complete
MQTNEERTIYYFDEDPGYETLRSITNGFFTTLKCADGRIIFLRDIGKYHQPINKEATEMFGIVMYGPIAIVGKVNDRDKTDANDSCKS